MSTLYVVATPIGNLSDLTRRAEETLRSVPVVVCEDTRVSGPLLQRIGSSARLIAHFKGREAERVDEILGLLNSGSDVALISDAGTPLIADPGGRLVARTAGAGHRIVPIPGPSAPVALLSAAGFETEAFTWTGFLPSKPADRVRTLSAHRDRTETLVFFESPRRLVETLSDCVTVFGAGRRAVVGRELTKLHEEIVRGTLKELEADFAARPEILGEVTVAIEGSTGERELAPLETLEAEIRGLIGAGEGTKQIAERISTLHGHPKKQVYDYVLKLLKDR